MAYLETLLTYSVPSEAEVDRAFLESEGIPVCLLNANTSRNELGAPFFVRLQVNQEDFPRAYQLIREHNPSRFGSSAKVAELDRQLKRALLRVAWVALTVGLAVGLIIYLRHR